MCYKSSNLFLFSCEKRVAILKVQYKKVTGYIGIFSAKTFYCILAILDLKVTYLGSLFRNVMFLSHFWHFAKFNWETILDILMHSSVLINMILKTSL